MTNLCGNHDGFELKLASNSHQNDKFAATWRQPRMKLASKHIKTTNSPQPRVKLAANSRFKLIKEISKISNDIKKYDKIRRSAFEFAKKHDVIWRTSKLLSS